MDLHELNEATNDIMVARLEIEEMEKWLQEELDKNPKIKQIEEKLIEKKNEKNVLQENLLEAMRENKLKSWKTEQASFSRASRTSLIIDPMYKKQVENKLKKGEKLEGYTLNNKEYISVRISK